MVGYQKQWEFLKNKFEVNQLSHAYLFSGQGIGKKEFTKEFTEEFIKSINCLYYKSNDREVCSIGKMGEICQNCKMIQNENFPDLLVVTSLNSKSSIDNEKDMMEIDVAQIREVNNFLSYKSYYGGYKTVIIDNAERMNVEAQNCFLKTLEEPKGKTIIFLLSLQPDMLLSTIFSRCQTIKFFPVGKYEESQEDQKILKDLLNIIDAELAMKFQYAKRINLEGENFSKILKVLQRYFRNSMLIKIGALKGEQLHNYSIEKLKKIITLIEALNIQVLKTNANAKLALEILLMEL